MLQEKTIRRRSNRSCLRYFDFNFTFEIDFAIDPVFGVFKQWLTLSRGRRRIAISVKFTLMANVEFCKFGIGDPVQVYSIT